MPTHRISIVYQTESETFTTASDITDDTGLPIDVTLTGTTPGTWTGAITVANLKSLMINTSAAVTVRATNSGGTILFGGSQLAAGTYIYPTQALAAAALGGSNITALYFVAEAGAVVKLRGILDQGAP